MSRQMFKNSLLQTRIGILAFLTFLSVTIKQADASSQSALLMDMRSGITYTSTNSNKTIDAGPLTQLMTLYIALDAINKNEVSPTEKLSVPPIDKAIQSNFLIPEESYSFLSLIQVIALKSSKQASIAIANRLSGSQAAFVRRMNRTARALGMINTKYVDPHGTTGTDNTTTADDLAILTRHLAFENERQMYMFSQKMMRLNNRSVVRAGNQFISSYSGAVGLMSTPTLSGHQNQISLAKQNNKYVLVITLGASNQIEANQETVQLMDLGFQLSPQNVPVSKPRTPVIQFDELLAKPEQTQTPSFQSQENRLPAAFPLVESFPIPPLDTRDFPYIDGGNMQYPLSLSIIPQRAPLSKEDEYNFLSYEDINGSQIHSNSNQIDNSTAQTSGTASRFTAVQIPKPDFKKLTKKQQNREPKIEGIINGKKVGIKFPGFVDQQQPSNEGIIHRSSPRQDPDSLFYRSNPR